MSTRIPLFDFISADHPFARQLAGFARAIEAHPEHERLQAAVLDGKATIHAEIKALSDHTGAWHLDRFYWSLQTWDGNPPLPFRSETLSFAAKDGATEWYAFPEDSYLKTMAPYFADGAASSGARVDVLRYVPLRRFTFRTVDAQGRPVIAKFKRRSRFQAAYALLERIHEAIRPERVGFSVAAPEGIDPPRCLYFQSALAGQNLVDLVDADNIEAMLGHVGALHHALHDTPIPGLPVQDREAFLADLRRDANWIGFMLPTYREPIDAAMKHLTSSAPDLLGRSQTVCHGDFVCSQLLVSENAWAVTDFDLCHQGDPYRDLAIFLASLAYEVPMLSHDSGLLERTTNAYLDGYCKHAGVSLDHPRLTFHRACAEIYYLALMLKKDRYDAPAFERRLALACRLSGELAGAGRGEYVS